MIPALHFLRTKKKKKKKTFSKRTEFAPRGDKPFFVEYNHFLKEGKFK